MKPPAHRLRRWTAILGVLFLSSVRALCWISSSEATRDLARKIATITGNKALFLEIGNQSSLPPKSVDDLQRELASGLVSLGVPVVPANQAASTARITFTENIEGYVIVAEIHRSGAPDSVLVTTFSKPPVSSTAPDPAPLSLHKALLWAQSLPILDAALVSDNAGGSHLFVLDPEAVTVYDFQAGQWKFRQKFAIAREKPWPRDLRGRLVLRPDMSFSAYLPAVYCESSGPTLACRPSDDPWPLLPTQRLRGFYAPARNFFTGVLSPGIGNISSTAKFYAGAVVPAAHSAVWLFTATDGAVHVVDGTVDRTAYWKWGSDIAGVQSPCGSGTQILATQSQSELAESLRAYEIVEHEAAPVSPELSFPGAITALWTDDKGSAAIAVSKNSNTGNYEAFRVTVSCSL